MEVVLTQAGEGLAIAITDADRWAKDQGNLLTSQGQLKIWPLRHPRCKETQGLLVKLEQPTSAYGHREAEGQTGWTPAGVEGTYSS